MNATQNNISRPSILKWDKLKESDKNTYSQRLSEIVFHEPSPLTKLNCEETCICRDAKCHATIQNEYNHLIQCLKKADHCLPRYRPGTEKDWWNDNLTQLRDKSKEIHAIWVSEGRPRHGATHSKRLIARAAYKRAIRIAQKAPKQRTWDRLHSELADKDTHSFWQSWRRLYNKNKSFGSCRWRLFLGEGYCGMF